MFKTTGIPVCSNNSFFSFLALCTFLKCVPLEGVRKLKGRSQIPTLKKILDYKETGGCTLISGTVISSVQTAYGNPEYEVFSLRSSKPGTVPAAPKSPWQKKHIYSRDLYQQLNKISHISSPCKLIKYFPFWEFCEIVLPYMYLYIPLTWKHVSHAC